MTETKPETKPESKPFWQTKTLEQMTRSEWESICDGCAKCCLHKFIEDDSVDEAQTSTHFEEGEQIHHTNIVCQYLNDKTCSCTQYAKRTKLVPDRVTLTKDNLKDVYFMPPSCSYRLLQEGKDLPSWHPLRHKGKKSKMHQAGMSVRNKVISEVQANLDDFENHIVTWPLNVVD